MLSHVVRLLNFDQSVARQVERIGFEANTVVPLDDLGRSARLWASEHQADAIRSKLDPAEKNAITFIGSGDYHYVSSLLLEEFREPLSLVVFDHHPDWDRLPPRYGCGAWVSRALERPNIQRVLLVGNASDDFAGLGSFAGNTPSARAGRTRLLPYDRSLLPSSLRAVGLISPDAEDLRADAELAFTTALAELPTREVYVSIDKDCLTSDYALTNWEEGRLELDVLIRLLSILKERCTIVGLDITGEYSAPHYTSLWKSFCSRWDHPRNYTARGRTPEEIDCVNGTTNLKLLETLKA